MTIHEIQTQITRLSNDDLTQLVDWLADYHHAVWDKQIEHDLRAGRLDTVLKEVDEEYEAGKAKPL